MFIGRIRCSWTNPQFKRIFQNNHSIDNSGFFKINRFNSFQYCTEQTTSTSSSKHANKIKKAKSNLTKTKKAKIPTTKKINPVKDVHARRRGDESDTELDEDQMDRVLQIEREHYEKYGYPEDYDQYEYQDFPKKKKEDKEKPAYVDDYDVMRIEEGDRTEDEEDIEFNETIDKTEPAYLLTQYQHILSVCYFNMI